MGHPIAPRSSRENIANAKALAIDLGEMEDGGREQGGNLAILMGEILRVSSGQVRMRVLREVLSNSNRGKAGDLIDTTEEDQVQSNLQALGGAGEPQWHLREGLSAATLVLELDEEDVDLAAAGDDVRRSIQRVLMNGTNDIAFKVLLEVLLTTRSTLVLDRIGMDPQEIRKLMKDNGITATSPVWLGEREMEGRM